MPRPRQYSSGAAKQAAYRARLATTTVLVDRTAWEHLHARLDTLQQVISQAAQRGDGLAKGCRAGSIDTMLDKLIATFESMGGCDREPAPAAHHR